MKKKSKIVVGLIVAFGLFMNISANIDTNSSHTLNLTNSFTTNEDKPIGGSH